MSHAMAGGEAEATGADEAVITRGTGNLLADPGHPDAEERQTRLRPAQVIDGPIGCGRPTRAAAARMGITRSTVSARANQRLEGFPVERLMLLLTVWTRPSRPSSAASRGRRRPGGSP